MDPLPAALHRCPHAEISEPGSPLSGTSPFPCSSASSYALLCFASMLKLMHTPRLLVTLLWKWFKVQDNIDSTEGYFDDILYTWLFFFFFTFWKLFHLLFWTLIEWCHFPFQSVLQLAPPLTFLTESKVTFRKKGKEIDELWHLEVRKKFWKENVIKK